MDFEMAKEANITLENQQLKDRLIDLESSYKQLEYCFKKVLNDQRYLLEILTADEKIMESHPQIKRISSEVAEYQQIFEQIRRFPFIVSFKSMVFLLYRPRYTFPHLRRYLKLRWIRAYIKRLPPNQAEILSEAQQIQHSSLRRHHNQQRWFAFLSRGRQTKENYIYWGRQKWGRKDYGGRIRETGYPAIPR